MTQYICYLSCENILNEMFACLKAECSFNWISKIILI